jgi:hypothetical protein
VTPGTEQERQPAGGSVDPPPAGTSGREGAAPPASLDGARDKSLDGAPAFGVHPLVPRLWFWQSLAFPLGVGVVAGISLLAAGHAALAALTVAAAGAAAWAASLHALAYAARLRLHLLPDGLLVQRGVWWRTEIFVPRARVQHTDVAQGPVGRRLGIATLKVFTAASHAGVIGVDGLDHADAVAVRDRLLGRGDPDAL